MKHIKTYEYINEEFNLIDRLKTKRLCFKYRNYIAPTIVEDGSKYNIDKDGYVNVNGGVNLSNLNLTEIPIKFGKINGNFLCNRNKLTSMNGFPKEVTGSIDCSNNKIENLRGSGTICYGLDIACNNISTLEGFPKFKIHNITSNRTYSNPIHIIHEFFWKGGNYGYLFNNENIELFNDYDIIREEKHGYCIVMDRFADFLMTINPNYYTKDNVYFLIRSKMQREDIPAESIMKLGFYRCI